MDNQGESGVDRTGAQTPGPAASVGQIHGWDRLWRHYAWLRTLPDWPLFWWLTIEGVILSLLLIPLLYLVFGDNPYCTQRLDTPPFVEFLIACVFAPVLETLLYQMLFVWLCRRVRFPFWAQVAVATLVFSLDHFACSFYKGLVGGLIGGFYLSFGYARWVENSVWRAVALTVLSHSLHNLFFTVVELVEKTLR